MYCRLRFQIVNKGKTCNFLDGAIEVDIQAFHYNYQNISIARSLIVKYTLVKKVTQNQPEENLVSKEKAQNVSSEDISKKINCSFIALLNRLSTQTVF